ncbi:MAG: prolipoprotein diacylglyceryl transferase [Candidatus Omnitrophica bacterium]|nr:prolipoprotein diacylglyceryl transferase [Candidatus Omnitrophota bacterium]
MHPIICQIGPFTIFSYGAAMAIGFIIAVFLARIQARKDNIDPDIIYNVTFISFILGILGARIFYVLSNLGFYSKNIPEIFMLQHGGLSVFGGLILGTAAAIVYLKIKKLSIYLVLDLLVPFLALGQAIGRIGCLLNGCCFGSTQIPVQIYSSLLLLSIFMILRFIQDSAHVRGSIFYSYLLLYSVKRFSIEFWRLDNPRIFFGLTIFQLICIPLFMISLAWLFARRNKHN